MEDISSFFPAEVQKILSERQAMHAYCNGHERPEITMACPDVTGRHECTGNMSEKVAGEDIYILKTSIRAASTRKFLCCLMLFLGWSLSCLKKKKSG